MRRSIISLNTYSWIKHCAGMISRDPKDFNVLIVHVDKKRPIMNYNSLCSDAIYVQRAHDLKVIGKKIGISKIANLMYDDENDIDIERLVTQLQLHLLIGGVREVYYQDSVLLENIIKKISKMIGIKCYKYGKIDNPSKTIELDEQEILNKVSLSCFMVGVCRSSEYPTLEKHEMFK